MKKYKCICEFPGVKYQEECHNVDREGGQFITESGLYVLDPKDHPKFWREVVEKEYEILSYKSLYNGTILFFKKKWDKDFFKNSEWSIHSVKRLSDGEVFTIGDSINSKQWSKSSINDVINSIFISDKKHSESFNNLPEKCIVLKTKLTWQTSLENAVKIVFKQKLFTTEDEVDIFEGDTYSYIRRDLSLYIDRVAGKNECSGDNLGYKNFSTREKAEEYIILNKLCLSYNDLSQYLVKVCDIGIANTVIVNHQILKELIKSKLNIK